MPPVNGSFQRAPCYWRKGAILSLPVAMLMSEHGNDLHGRNNHRRTDALSHNQPTDGCLLTLAAQYIFLDILLVLYIWNSRSSEGSFAPLWEQMSIFNSKCSSLSLSHYPGLHHWGISKSNKHRGCEPWHIASCYRKEEECITPLTDMLKYDAAYKCNQQDLPHFHLFHPHSSSR